MQLHLNSTDLLEGLQAIIGVVEKKQVTPALSHVLFEADQDGLKMIATDNQIEIISIMYSIDLSERQSFSVPAQKIFDVVKALPSDEDVIIALDISSLKVTCLNADFMLVAHPANEFPRFEAQPTDFTLHLPLAGIKMLCKKTLFAVGQQSFRDYLKGLLLCYQDEELIAVGCDSHRMAVAKLALDSGFPENFDVILPKKTAIELLKLPDETAEISFAPGFIRIVTKTLIFSSRLINAKYPDFNRVLPSGSSTRFHVKHSDLKNGLNRASVMANTTTNAVFFEITPFKLKLQSCNANHETGQAEIPITYEGDQLEAVFKAPFVLEALNSLNPASEVEVEFFFDTQRIVMRESGDNQVLLMVMPLKV